MFDWQSRRVLVTGASGFVGSWLVKALLERGAEVTALIRDLDDHSELVRSGAVRRISIVHGELEDCRAVLRAVNDSEAEVVFHLAAQALVVSALRSPLATFESNIRGTYHLLEACRNCRDTVRAVVVASSDKAYGTAENLPYTEDQPLNGRHPYDVSKSCTDLLAATYFETYGLPVAVSRCGNIYGGGDLNFSRIVPGTIRSILEEKRPVLRSDGGMVRDYIYVEDAVDAYLALAARIDDPRVAGGGFNFSTESYVTVREIVAAIQLEMRAEHLEPVVLGGAKHEIVNQSLSARKARDVLNWSARHDLAAGLRKSIAWYREYLEGERGRAARHAESAIPVKRAG